MSIIRKYHNHKLQTTPWHREEEPLNRHETPGRQIKQSLFIYLFKSANIMFLSCILFELLDVEHGSHISLKNIKMSKVNSLDLELAIDPLPQGNFAHYNFLILHYINHKIKYVSPLRKAVLACNITLRTLPAK